jgi:predicted Zn-dependent peptidase
MVTFAGIKKERVEDAVRIIVQEYKKIREELCGPEELQKAKAYLKGKLTLRLEGSDDIAMFLGEQEIVTHEPLRPEVLFEKLETIKAEEVLRVAKEMIRPDRLNMALIAPFRSEKKLLEILHIL